MMHIDICWNQHSTQIKNVPYLLKSCFVPIEITYVLNSFTAQYKKRLTKHVCKFTQYLQWLWAKHDITEHRMSILDIIAVKGYAATHAMYSLQFPNDRHL